MRDSFYVKMKERFGKAGFSRVTYVLAGSFFCGLLMIMLLAKCVKGDSISVLKFTLLVVSSLFAFWGAWLFDQKQKNLPVAYKWIEEKTKEFYSVSFDQLADRVGKGYLHETRLIDGVTYRMGFAMSWVDDLELAGSASVERLKIQSADMEEEAIEIIGYVDCISILPWGDFKVGPGFRVVVSRDQAA